MEPMLPDRKNPEPETMTDRAYNLIADAIVRGELQAGARISEAALAQRFEIGRGPLREALRRLEGRKLVVVKPNVGARVVSLTARDIIELFEIREILEARACELATERMPDSELDALDELLDAHDKDPNSGRAYSRMAAAPDFHTAIITGSKNNQLISLLCGELFDLLRIYRFKSSGNEGRTEVAFREHREIANAMKARDGERAAQLMRRHIRKSRSNLLRLEGITSLILSEAELENGVEYDSRADRKNEPRAT
jgi:DNA-binding GntR family transcriptional regulator